MTKAFGTLLFVIALLTAAMPEALALQSDDRVETVAYKGGDVVPLRSALGSGVMVIFAADEHVLGFDIVDPDAISVESWANPGSMFVKTNGIPSAQQLKVRTQLRSYDFSVSVGPPDAAVAVVRFSYDAAASDDNGTAIEISKPQYRLTGEKVLRPERISDDGVRTFIIWGQDQALPAVFAVNPFGDEEIVDGYMRNGVFTIDRVYAKLVFRIDRKAAKAERLPG